MKGKWFVLGSVLTVLLLALAVGLSQAQEPPPTPEAPAGETGKEGDVGIEAIVESVIPIQGRLTDPDGNPVPDGNYNITARLYNVLSGGTALCSDEDSVSVANGLFNMEIDHCTAANINGQELYLGIKVGSDAEMTPRQPIYPVPYAWSLRPGAQIAGDVTASPYAALHVRNTANSGSAYGVRGETNSPSGRGVFGNGLNGGTGVYGRSDSGVAIQAEGTGIIRSTAATDWVVSPLKIVPGDYGSNWDDLQIVPSAQHGYAKLYTTGQDDCQALVPVDVAALLFGTRVQLSYFYFCYRMDSTGDQITRVDVEYVGDDGNAYNLCSYTTAVSSLTWACEACTPASPAGIWGPVFVRFSLHFAADGSTRAIRLGQMYLHLTE